MTSVLCLKSYEQVKQTRLKVRIPSAISISCLKSFKQLKYNNKKPNYDLNLLLEEL